MTGVGTTRQDATWANAWTASAMYLLITIYVTWPLAGGLARDVASDLGDPLLNMWILSWDCEQLKAILSGHFGRVAHLFDANIFHPAPLTLAYSEHLLPQAIQILPIYVATNNPILCYNLLFLSTYVLSGAGTFLLVRQLTGDWRAAFLAGLLFAFAPYRISQAPHMQVLSAQWMPFTLYGFARYLDTRRRPALAGGALALVLQSLSCGYYLLYFAPFAVAYLLWEIGRRRLWTDTRLWKALAVAACVSAAALVPFVLPYARVHASLEMTREDAEVTRFSADVYSYFTADATQNIWGDIVRMAPKPEGQLFPGAVPLLLGLLAFGAWARRAWKAGGDREGRGPRITAILSGIAACLSVGLIVLTIFQRRLTIDLGLFTLKVGNIGHTLIWLAASLAVLLGVSARARTRLRALVTEQGFFCVAIVATWWLSLGPDPRVFGRPLDLPAPYAVLYDVVPGFEGLRVPARYAMVLAFALAVAGALAATSFLRRRRGLALLAVLSVAFVAESHATAFSINGTTDRAHAPDARVYPPARAPAIYRAVAALGQDTVLLELPIGIPEWDLRTIYYSTAHWHPVVNGYSGFFPPGYGLLVVALADPPRDPDLAWQVVQAYGTTHILVHDRGFAAPQVARVEQWLAASGAREIGRAGTDTLYEVRR